MRDSRLYLEDILEALVRIGEYVDGLSYEAFSRDRKTVDAVVRNFEVVGEAAKRMPVGVKRRYPGVPWATMAGMRDKLMHAYLGVDLKVLWATVREDVPPLRVSVESILRELEDG